MVVGVQLAGGSDWRGPEGGTGRGRPRGVVTVTIELPRFVIAKVVKCGTAFYWSPPTYWKTKAKTIGRIWPFGSQPLGFDLSSRDLRSAAHRFNLQFDAWLSGNDRTPLQSEGWEGQGSVAWLLHTYQSSDIFLRRVKERSRPDYRRLFDKLIALRVKSDTTFGQLLVWSVTPSVAEAVYSTMIDEGRFRRGEKAVTYLKTVWRLMQPHHPQEFRKDVPNPWSGVQLVSRVRATKASHDRDDVYNFAWKAIEAGQPELGAAAVICFEWLQRPENVLSGSVRWQYYRRRQYIRVAHHKTGEVVQHPLVDVDGTPFYPEAEDVLAKLPIRGIAMILRADGFPYEPTRFAQMVRKIADAAGLPKTFNLDTCRHGGMTELEEAGLTDGQGRALSAHKSRAYEGYAKRTEKRMLFATRRRIAYRRNSGA